MPHSGVCRMWYPTLVLDGTLMFVSKKNPVAAILRRLAHKNQILNIPSLGQSFLRNNYEKKTQYLCYCSVCVSVCLSTHKHTHTSFYTSAPLAGHLCSFQRQAFSIRWLPVVLTVLCLTFTLIREGCLSPQISSLFIYFFNWKKSQMLTIFGLGKDSHPYLNLMW